MKKSIIKPERRQKVIESNKQLLDTLKKEADFIAREGPAIVPEIDFELLRENRKYMCGGISGAMIRICSCMLKAETFPRLLST
ncbi:hypothetical protein GCM10020218_103890 [Dactylosporangium vinaceum]